MAQIQWRGSRPWKRVRNRRVFEMPPEQPGPTVDTENNDPTMEWLGQAGPGADAAAVTDILKLCWDNGELEWKLL